MTSMISPYVTSTCVPNCPATDSAALIVTALKVCTDEPRIGRLVVDVRDTGAAFRLSAGDAGKLFVVNTDGVVVRMPSVHAVHDGATFEFAVAGGALTAANAATAAADAGGAAPADAYATIDIPDVDAVKGFVVGNKYNPILHEVVAAYIQPAMTTRRIVFKKDSGDAGTRVTLTLVGTKWIVSGEVVGTSGGLITATVFPDV